MRGGGGHVFSKSKGVGWTRVCDSVLSTEIRGHVYRCLYDKDELNKTHPGIHIPKITARVLIVVTKICIISYPIVFRQ